MRERAPCLTQSHTRGQWVTSRGRRIGTHELLCLQGFPPTARGLRIPVSDARMCRMLGNSMCVPAIAAILRHLLLAAGLWTPPLAAPVGDEAVVVQDSMPGLAGPAHAAPAGYAGEGGGRGAHPGGLEAGSPDRERITAAPRSAASSPLWAPLRLARGGRASGRVSTSIALDTDPSSSPLWAPLRGRALSPSRPPLPHGPGAARRRPSLPGAHGLAAPPPAAPAP